MRKEEKAWDHCHQRYKLKFVYQAAQRALFKSEQGFGAEPINRVQQPRTERSEGTDVSQGLDINKAGTRSPAGTYHFPRVAIKKHRTLAGLHHRN